MNDAASLEEDLLRDAQRGSVNRARVVALPGALHVLTLCACTLVGDAEMIWPGAFWSRSLWLTSAWLVLGVSFVTFAWAVRASRPSIAAMRTLAFGPLFTIALIAVPDIALGLVVPTQYLEWQAPRFLSTFALGAIHGIVAAALVQRRTARKRGKRLYLGVFVGLSLTLTGAFASGIAVVCDHWIVAVDGLTFTTSGNTWPPARVATSALGALSALVGTVYVGATLAYAKQRS
jgi:hypothetical protein